MYCKYCGKQIIDDKEFCSSCGKKVIEIKKEDDLDYKKLFYNRSLYIAWLIVIIIPALINRYIIAIGEQPLIITEEGAMLLTIITKLSYFAVTVWYAWKIKIKGWKIIILGIITLLPFGVWGAIIYLFYKTSQLIKNSKKK